MTLGQTPNQGSLLRSSTDYCRERLSETSIYSLLHRESHRLFPDESFADLFRDIGRRSIPPRIVAVVMMLQRATATRRVRADLMATKATSLSIQTPK